MNGRRCLPFRSFFNTSLSPILTLRQHRVKNGGLMTPSAIRGRPHHLSINVIGHGAFLGGQFPTSSLVSGLPSGPLLMISTE